MGADSTTLRILSPRPESRVDPAQWLLSTQAIIGERMRARAQSDAALAADALIRVAAEAELGPGWLAAVAASEGIAPEAVPAFLAAAADVSWVDG